MGYEIIGVSADNEKSQKKFSDKFGFNYSLLCDENKDLINAYGVWGLKKFMGKEYMGIIRKTFTIDEEGKISQIIDKVKTKEHTSQILD
jgi:peroxiredoxin Q/BCP